MLARILQIIDRLSQAGAVVAFVMICGIAVFILAEIAARTLFNVSLSFAWEYSTYFMAVGIFCGAGYTLRTGGHVRVWLFSSNLPPRISYAVDVFATLLSIVIAGFIGYAMIQVALLSYLHGSRASTITEIPLAIPQGGIALGAMLLFLQLVARLVRLITGEATEPQGPQQPGAGNP